LSAPSTELPIRGQEQQFASPPQLSGWFPERGIRRAVLPAGWALSPRALRRNASPILAWVGLAALSPSQTLVLPRQLPGSSPGMNALTRWIPVPRGAAGARQWWVPSMAPQAANRRQPERPQHWRPAPWPRRRDWRLPASPARNHWDARYPACSVAHCANHRGMPPRHLGRTRPARQGWTSALHALLAGHPARHSSQSPQAPGRPFPAGAGKGLRFSVCVLYCYRCCCAGRYRRESSRCRGCGPWTHPRRCVRWPQCHRACRGERT
jgi:hypothetical protein